jgi:hypothetical protein
MDSFFRRKKKREKEEDERERERERARATDALQKSTPSRRPNKTKTEKKAALVLSFFKPSPSA